MCKYRYFDISFHVCIVGVNMSSKGDTLGQQYVSPADAVMLRGADVIIVGRGILNSDDVKSTAASYQAAGYEAYETLRTQQKSDR